MKALDVSLHCTQRLGGFSFHVIPIFACFCIILGDLEVFHFTLNLVCMSNFFCIIPLFGACFCIIPSVLEDFDFTLYPAWSAS